ncbi:mitochondrial inner membrane magnesium transporter lpe10 [Yamadazyma tenuis]|nr:uncharacterized protein CANTEDRAFT_114415 [Yamadazyma tenuis ATCC 10573]EGV63545.1 hypothetical protein CANTEDRAFT_114415 [Yamadazyma tenuis ATCC 10573]WEJ97083.1 mitochondrial inner membrane magnesium transporter lpe10 [Yamadazyma tenuis]
MLVSKTLTSNKTNDDYIRCTIFDQQGNIRIQGKDIKRSEFLKSNNLVARDLRKISKTNTPNSASYINLEVVPSIVTRSSGILLNLLNIRAMIKPDMVVLFDNPTSTAEGPAGAGLNESYTHGTLLENMRKGLGNQAESSQLPYEFRALETILNHVVEELSSEMKLHTTSLKNLLDGLEDSIDSHRLRYLLIQSKKMTQFLRKATLVRDSLDEVLDNDDVLNSLYLNEKRFNSNHEEVELLLEAYYVTMDEIVQKVQNLIAQTKSTNEIVNIILDSNRNEIMLLGLKFGVGMLSMAVALYAAAVYGMNLENFIEETDFGFPVVIAGSFLLLFIYLRVSVHGLRKISKVTMTGNFKNDKMYK